MRYFMSSTGLLMLACTATAAGQGIGDRIASAKDGTVRMAFTAREGICGDG